MTGLSRTAPGDDSYPEGLNALEERPSLFYLGSLPHVAGVAVVGSRRATRYGVALAEAFGAALARAGWATVSGMARGIDTAAHRGSLEEGGVTVAVLGCGVDVCYPPENRLLYERIPLRGGAILSEYPPGTRPDRWRFPARNRIIAAMAEAVVVVESAAKGGALITGRLAAEMGRMVFAVPGDVDREMSEGCNRLIRDGAQPVLGATDLIEELSLVIGPPVGSHESTEVGLPPEGVSVEDLADLWQVDTTESLIRLGRLEMEGKVRRVGDRVIPV